MYSPYQLRKKILVMSHAWFPFKITGSTGLDDEIDDTLKIKMILSPITALFVEDKRIKDEEMATNPFACSNMWARDFRTYLAAEGKKEVRMETRKNLWKVTHKDISAGVTLDPWEFWNNGVCMVGQNHSKCDKYILYGHGKFSLNGGVACGYVAKPPVLIDPQAGEPTLTTQFTFTLISGQNLSQLITKRNPELEYHMYVEVEFRGMKQETEKNVMWRSAICSLNLFHPYWISDDHKFQSFTFETKFPNFSILVIRAIEARDGTILGRCAIPMSACRSGYRAVQLLDYKHHKIPNTFLLLNVGKRKMRP